MTPAAPGRTISWPPGAGAAALYLSLLALLCHASGFGPLGVVLFPFALIMAGFTPIAYLWVALAGFLLLFESSQPGSNAGPFNAPDLAAAAFLLHSLLTRRNLDFRLPISGLLLVLYAFIAYCLLLSIGPAFTLGPLDNWYLRDLKCILYLAMAAVLSRQPTLGPKNLTGLLLGVVLLTTGHACFMVLEFLLRGGRIITWNEVFFADSLVLAAVLFSVPQLKRCRRALGAGMGIIALATVFTQSRGVWLGAAFSLGLYALVQVVTADRTKLKGMGRTLLAAGGIVLLTLVVLKVAFGFDVVGSVQNRFSGAASATELINPYSSLGYRIHESLSVWEERSWFGHGSGARLHLFFTQLGKSGMMDWWAIHSEYFEVLHKYGFIGLGVFLLLLGLMAWRALRLALLPRPLHSAMGFAVLLTLSNHAITSITSGYLLRENVVLYLALLVVILERFYPAVRRHRAAARRRVRQESP